MVSGDLKKTVLEGAYQSAQSTFRTSITINAGAVAALLAFAGADKVSNPDLLAMPLLLFAGGVTIGALGTILAYAANFSFLRWSFYAEHIWLKLEPWFGVPALICALLSVGAFMTGMVFVGMAAARLPLNEAPRLVGDENGGYVLTSERTMAAAIGLVGDHCNSHRKFPVLTEITPKTLGQIKFDCIVYQRR